MRRRLAWALVLLVALVALNRLASALAAGGSDTKVSPETSVTAAVSTTIPEKTTSAAGSNPAPAAPTETASTVAAGTPSSSTEPSLPAIDPNTDIPQKLATFVTNRYGIDYRPASADSLAARKQAAREVVTSKYFSEWATDGEVSGAVEKMKTHQVVLTASADNLSIRPIASDSVEVTCLVHQLSVGQYEDGEEQWPSDYQMTSVWKLTEKGWLLDVVMVWSEQQ